MIQAFSPVVLATYALAYAGIGDEDLDRYATFLASKPGMKFNGQCLLAFDRALTQAAREFGQGLPTARSGASHVSERPGASPGRNAMKQTFPRCDATAAWAALRGHFEAHGRDLDLREAFARDPARFERFAFEAPEVFCDLSKNRIDAATLHFLADLARECGVEARRDAMLARRADQRHRRPGGAAHRLARAAGRGAVLATRCTPCSRRCSPSPRRCARADARRGRSATSSTSASAAATSGRRWRSRRSRRSPHPRLDLHFVSNVDGHDIASVLRRVAPAETLFIVASKTFTTQETMANAATAKAWFLASGGSRRRRALRRRDDQRRGGGALRHHPHLRLLRLGRRPLLALVGDRPADRDRRRRRRLPRAARRRAGDGRALRRRRRSRRTCRCCSACSTSGTATSTASRSRSVAPYHHGLKRLPAYLQQLEMESNGKRVDRDGRALPYRDQPGGLGRAGHQRPARLLPDAAPGHGHDPGRVHPGEARGRARGATRGGRALARQQRMLLANGLAQSQALMQGKQRRGAGRAAPTASRRSTPRRWPRTAPSRATGRARRLLLERLTPRSLGALIALYEHRVFTAGAVWGIDSFDQWGVELGKVLGNAPAAAARRRGREAPKRRRSTVDARAAGPPGRTPLGAE